MKFLSSISLMLLFIVSSMNAQMDAPDFTVTDLDGVEHNLYTILESDKVVIFDVSATWCPPCWSMHTEHYLQDIHAKYGPDGTDQVRVIWYEGDAATGQSDLEGGGNSMGNWLTDTEYPIINETPLSVDLSIWAPLGFPTVNVIRPADKKIIADLYDTWFAGEGLEGMEAIIEGAFSSVDVKQLETLSISVYPNPMQNDVTLDLTKFDGEVESVELVNLLGQVVMTKSISANTTITLNVSNLHSGLYMMNLRNGQEILGAKKLIKE